MKKKGFAMLITVIILQVITTSLIMRLQNLHHYQTIITAQPHEGL